MLVCTKKEVTKYLEKDKVKKLYLEIGYDDQDIFDLVDEINEDRDDDDKLEVEFLEKEKLDKMMKEDKNEGIVADVPDKGIIIILFLIISALLLFFVVVGISFSIFEVTMKGEQETQNIIVNYSDVNGNGNGINIQNASPISDQEGKILIGNGNYFDFSVSGNTSNIPVIYYIVVDKLKESTLANSNVKLYLTSTKGSLETAIVNPVTYNLLVDKSIDGKEHKLLYSRKLDKNVKEFIDNYRLRMWVDSNASDYYQKTFAVKVHVLAEGIGE